jgi:hypothetical protein
MVLPALFLFYFFYTFFFFVVALIKNGRRQRQKFNRVYGYSVYVYCFPL